ncbi:MAG: sugar phosphate isomerase/epimerase [Acidobacteria bacterium]|nr:sugar phosphate isomerase/epimerase [Acidobacteriota bacterium]
MRGARGGALHAIPDRLHDPALCVLPLGTGLQGIAAAGYRHVGWGSQHRGAAGARAPVLAPDGPPAEARRLAERCRALDLEPVLMFAGIYVAADDSVRVHTRRIEQAAAAGIPFVITFGEIKAGGREVWIRNLKQLGPVARGAGVTIVLKQHGGNTATGRLCSKILEEVGDEGVKMCYDAGNVLDYENADPIPDIQACWQDVRAVAIKDHRNTPKDEDCGPGFGEIDHYKLLMPLLRSGRTIPLVCENIFEPLLPRPSVPEGVDRLAQRAREYLETVIRGLQSGA